MEDRETALFSLKIPHSAKFQDIKNGIAKALDREYDPEKDSMTLMKIEYSSYYGLKDYIIDTSTKSFGMNNIPYTFSDTTLNPAWKHHHLIFSLT